MKAVFMPFRKDDGLVRVIDDHPALSFNLAYSATELAPFVDEIELLVINDAVCSPEIATLLRDRARKLKWVQFCTAGMQRGLKFGFPPGLIIAGASGIKAPTVAEHAMLLVLTLLRRFRDMERARAARHWAKFEISPLMGTLEDATLVIIGYGTIGQEIARKAKAFDTTVLVVSRAAEAGPNVDAVMPRSRLHEALARADAVVLCTAYSAETKDMIGKAEFAAMKRSAYFVNVARGEMVDEDAMVDALRDGTIRGAGLDVTIEEPLPASSRLWDLDTVLFSHHLAGGGSSGYGRFSKLFAENLRRYRLGERLLQQVDRETVEGNRSA